MINPYSDKDIDRDLVQASNGAMVPKEMLEDYEISLAKAFTQKGFDSMVKGEDPVSFAFQALSPIPPISKPVEIFKKGVKYAANTTKTVDVPKIFNKSMQYLNTALSGASIYSELETSLREKYGGKLRDSYTNNSNTTR